MFVEDTEDERGPQPVIVDSQSRSYPQFNDGQIYLRTNLDAPLNRVVRVDPARPGPDHWEEVIPKAADVLQGFAFIGEKIYATYLHDVSDEIRVFEMDGTPASELEVAAQRSVSIAASGDGNAELTVTGHLAPSETYEIDLGTGDRELTEGSRVPFDATGFAVSQTWYTSKDGTSAPMYVLHGEDMTLDGSHPTLLTGYGGFNASQKPSFSTSAAVWLESGGVYAVATLRGGSEFGEEWHLSIQFAVSGRQIDADESADGTFHHRTELFGEAIDFHGVLTCLAIDAAEGRAWVGGVVTQNFSEREPFASGEIYQPGRDIWFRVLDNGQPSEGIDRTTFTGVAGGAGFITSKDYCDARPWPDDNARTNAVTTGNIKVMP